MKAIKRELFMMHALYRRRSVLPPLVMLGCVHLGLGAYDLVRWLLR